MDDQNEEYFPSSINPLKNEDQDYEQYVEEDQDEQIANTNVNPVELIVPVINSTKKGRRGRAK